MAKKMNHDNFLEEWEKTQRNIFLNIWDKKWKKKFPCGILLKDKIKNLRYNNFNEVSNAFGKLDKALQISDFLYKLASSKPPQDTEKIIITTLISCAEAIYRINKPNEIVNENLIKGFFKPVKEKIDDKIKGYIDNNSMPYEKIFEAVEVLYLIRNDYIHNGEFTGKFFRNKSSESNTDNMGMFYFTEKGKKAGLIQVISECSLTYQDFLKIFLEAFIRSIEKYCIATVKKDKNEK